MSLTLAEVEGLLERTTKPLVDQLQAAQEQAARWKAEAEQAQEKLRTRAFRLGIAADLLAAIYPLRPASVPDELDRCLKTAEQLLERDRLLFP